MNIKKVGKTIFMELKARLAREDDLMLIFNWANDSLTRRMSFNQDPIPLGTHKEWFGKVLNQQKIHLLIIEGYESSNWVPIAQVRVDEDGEISMSLASEFRGQHLATPIIKVGIAYIKREFLIDKLAAHIKHKNIVSVRAFERAGFHYTCETTVKEHLCLEYIYKI